MPGKALSFPEPSLEATAGRRRDAHGAADRSLGQISVNARRPDLSADRGSQPASAFGSAIDGAAANGHVAIMAGQPHRAVIGSGGTSVPV